MENEKLEPTIQPTPTRAEIADMLGEMIKSYEHLPPGAMLHPVTHADLYAVLLLLSATLRAS
jgi:hypothetical protein